MNDTTIAKTNFMDKLSKIYVWIIVGVGLFISFLYEIMVVDKPAIEWLTDWKMWVGTTLTLALHLLLIGEAISKSIIDSIETIEFKIADEKNDIIIEDVRNNFDEFHKYINALNDNEKRIAQESYLTKVGVALDHLNEEQLIEFNNLEYDRHIINDFATPILYTKNKNREITYSANFDEQSFRRKGLGKKTITTFVFSALTIGISFTFDNVLGAVINLGITAGGLMITYLINYAKPKYILQTLIPQQVKGKEVLYKSFKNYQKGALKLKTSIEIEEIIIETKDEAKDEKVIKEPVYI